MLYDKNIINVRIESMKYRNAIELLPLELLQELQRYAQGEVIYVPKVKRKPWGEGTGTSSKAR